MIDVIYTHFPHYRTGVFRELFLIDPATRVYCDPVGSDKSIKNGYLREVRYLKTYRIMGLIFQRNLINLYFNSSNKCIVALANPANLTLWVLLVLNYFRSKKKVLLWSHGYYNNRDGLRNKLKDLFFGLSNGLLLYSEYSKDIADRRVRVPVKCIYNSLDESRMDCNPNPVSPEVVRLLFVGRLTKSVCLDVALNAIHTCHRKNIELDIIGEGEDARNLIRLAAVNNVTTRFHGAIYDERTLGDFFNKADYVISPGKIGLLQLHANLYGVPTITHNTSSEQMPEYDFGTEGVSVFSFDKGNIKSLRDLIQDLCKTSESTKLAISRSTRERYSSKLQARRIYESCA